MNFDSNARMENVFDDKIDFLVQGKTSVIPIEVKAEENLRAKSLRAFCDKYNPDYAVRTSMSDYREQDWMTNHFHIKVSDNMNYLKMRRVRKLARRILCEIPLLITITSAIITIKLAQANTS